MASARASELEREYPFGVVRQLFEPMLVGATFDFLHQGVDSRYIGALLRRLTPQVI